MKREPVLIQTDFIKLDSLLKFCGAAGTGGHAKEMILNGEIQVNGEVCTQRGKKLYPGSMVTVGSQEYEVVFRAH